jgi:calcineurin-like phosphoesterase family protein
MDRVLIERWNSVVGETDTVYHLGDFTFGNRDMAREYFKQLNGIIYVLFNPWHHDSRWLPKSGDIVPDCGTKNAIAVGLRPPIWVLEFPEYSNSKHSKALVLCHYPLAIWDRKHYGAWHLFGHSHGQHQNGGLSFDVGVDCNQFQPVSLEGVCRQMKAYGDDVKC